MQATTADKTAWGDVERTVWSNHHASALIRADRTIAAANEQYAMRFSPQGEDMVGRHCFTVNHGLARPCDEMGVTCPLRASQRDGRVAEVCHQHLASRDKVNERITIHPVRTTDQSFLALMEIVPAPDHQEETRERLIGTSAAFQKMMSLVERVATSDIPALLLGESGTGKELVARQIHDLSSRRRHAFVPVDCSGLSESLFESEMFGHERGAFTGAASPKRGLVEAASGGTLFLDEIGDVPLPQQVKLLRLLETGVYRRIGSTEQRQSDFRLVCATHRDLAEMVETGGFRRDLYYRINAFPIETPPLRERAEDISVLSEQLLLRIGGSRSLLLSRESLDILERHCFPGNVRELLNTLQRASLLTDDAVIRPEHLPEELLESSPTPECLKKTRAINFRGPIVPLAELEKRYLRWASARCDGNRRDLARTLGLSERTLYRKLAGH